MPIATTRKSLLGRADRILSRTSIAVAAGAGAGLLGMPQSAEAAIIYSGAVNIPIPLTFGGVYLNVVTNATSGSSFSGFDVNPYGITYMRWFSGTSPNAIVTGAGATTNLFDNLGVGTLVDGTSTFTGGVTNPETTGATVFNFNSDNNYVGIRFVNEALANQTQFGWVQLHLGASFTDPARAIIGYAYEDTGAGITIAPVPEPSSLAFLSMGAAGLIARRRLRRKAAAEVAAEVVA